jgi:hypothetical protein
MQLALSYSHLFCHRQEWKYSPSKSDIISAPGSLGATGSNVSQTPQTKVRKKLILESTCAVATPPFLATSAENACRCCFSLHQNTLGCRTEKIPSQTVAGAD